MTLQEIEERISVLKEERKNVTGRETEVYSRIVGYYRSLNNWNKGKREEYNYRIHYNSKYTAVQDNLTTEEPKQGELTLIDEKAVKEEITSYLFFYRQTCPNCPPMKDALKEVSLKGQWIDVDSDEGYSLAEKYMITAAPTVVFTDETGKEFSRAMQPSEIGNMDPAAAVT